MHNIGAWLCTHVNTLIPVNVQATAATRLASGWFYQQLVSGTVSVRNCLSHGTKLAVYRGNSIVHASIPPQFYPIEIFREDSKLHHLLFGRWRFCYTQCKSVETLSKLSVKRKSDDNQLCLILKGEKLLWSFQIRFFKDAAGIIDNCKDSNICENFFYERLLQTCTILSLLFYWIWNVETLGFLEFLFRVLFEKEITQQVSRDRRRREISVFKTTMN